MDKLVMLDAKEYPEWYKKSETHYNKLPKNWREIKEPEFVTALTRGFTYTEYRQAPLTKAKGAMYESIHMFYTEEAPVGVAVVPVIEGCTYTRMRYFAFGCDHQWTGGNLEWWKKNYPQHVNKLTFGRCCHNMVCYRCGTFNFVDSSD